MPKSAFYPPRPGWRREGRAPRTHGTEGPGTRDTNARLTWAQVLAAAAHRHHEHGPDHGQLVKGGGLPSRPLARSPSPPGPSPAVDLSDTGPFEYTKGAHLSTSPATDSAADRAVAGRCCQIHVRHGTRQRDPEVSVDEQRTELPDRARSKAIGGARLLGDLDATLVAQVRTWSARAGSKKFEAARHGEWVLRGERSMRAVMYGRSWCVCSP